jgi:hypothetical protein
MPGLFHCLVSSAVVELFHAVGEHQIFRCRRQSEGADVAAIAAGAPQANGPALVPPGTGPKLLPGMICACAEPSSASPVNWMAVCSPCRQRRFNRLSLLFIVVSCVPIHIGSAHTGLSGFVQGRWKKGHRRAVR